MAAPVAIAVYSLAFLILILYTIDAFVQWRNPREESWKYFTVQGILIICIFTGEVVLVVYNEKEVKPAILHGLQALSLLLSLIIDVRVFLEANSPVLTIYRL
jgi:NADH:ubiquinone oxidoreductase subunit 6 (subunit J)